jgi:S-adenosylmethionine hydrolase
MIDMPKAHSEEGIVSGYFEIVDPNFGNMWSNILAEDFEHAGFEYGEELVLKVEHEGETVLEKAMPYCKAFGDVKKGEPLLYTNELLHVSAALSEGSMLEEYKLGFGPEWKVEIRRK